MKKNIALAMIAFVFAVGSAVASRVLVDPEHVFVHAQFGNQASDIVCIDTQVSCTQSPNNICSVTVPLSNNTTDIASTNGTNKTYRTDCVIVLGNPTALSVTSPLTGSARPTRILP